MISKKTVWIIVTLIGLYIACQLIADIGATKLVTIGGVVIPGGTFIFALTFTLRDLIHKRLGKNWARAAIVCAGAFNLVMMLYLGMVAQLPSPDFRAEMGAAWDMIFAWLPSIVLGSIIAEVISEWVDTEVYHAWWKKFPKWPQWTRVLVSNGVSLPLDSFLFALFAFTLFPQIFGGHYEPISVALAITMGQIIYKGIVTLVSMPLIYLVPEKPMDTKGLA